MVKSKTLNETGLRKIWAWFLIGCVTLGSYLTSLSRPCCLPVLPLTFKKQTLFQEIWVRGCISNKLLSGDAQAAGPQTILRAVREGLENMFLRQSQGWIQQAKEARNEK